MMNKFMDACFRENKLKGKGGKEMCYYVLAETRLGIVQFDWTFLFQIGNMLLIMLLIYVMYKIIKNVIVEKQSLEKRVSKLEDEVDKLREL